MWLGSVFIGLVVVGGGMYAGTFLTTYFELVMITFMRKILEFSQNINQQTRHTPRPLPFSPPPPPPHQNNTPPTKTTTATTTKQKTMQTTSTNEQHQQQQTKNSSNNNTGGVEKIEMKKEKEKTVD